MIGQSAVPLVVFCIILILIGVWCAKEAKKEPIAILGVIYAGGGGSAILGAIILHKYFPNF